VNDFAEFCSHSVTVETYQGSGGMGASYADPVTYSPDTDTGVMVDNKRRLVRDAAAKEVVSESTIHDPDISHADTYKVGSKVALPDGRRVTVIITKVWSAPDTVLPQHVEVALT